MTFTDHLIWQLRMTKVQSKHYFIQCSLQSTEKIRKFGSSNNVNNNRSINEL